jgi:hypothetical protein
VNVISDRAPECISNDGVLILSSRCLIMDGDESGPPGMDHLGKMIFSHVMISVNVGKLGPRPTTRPRIHDCILNSGPAPLPSILTLLRYLNT